MILNAGCPLNFLTLIILLSLLSATHHYLQVRMSSTATILHYSLKIKELSYYCLSYLYETFTINRVLKSEEVEFIRECRICHLSEEDEADGGGEWSAPCKCAGSLKWIHVRCLNTWLEYTPEQQHCSICQ